jgi:predicted Ser/Thr protein kinase
MDTVRICKQCRQPLPENAPEGLCPECLARVAVGSEPTAPGTRVPPDPAALAAQFPQLEIIKLLGMGGMGMVYQARQPRLDRLVALKILPVDDSTRDASFAERFEREARALARLNHPGIVTLYDFGQTPGYYYFIMEYVDGMNLRQLIQAQTLEPRQALELVTQICAALQFAHDEKIVHRDIKPENILITKKGQVKIADFGLAKLLGGKPETALTASQMVMGTMNYMAPEQREKPLEVDHRADIYSLGVVFYEMLTGEVPMGRFEAPSKKVRIDVRLDEVVLHALEREPSRRYQHVSEVKSNVETITSTMPREKNAAGTPEALKPQPPPGFASYVLKRFGIFVLAWLLAGLCLRWAARDMSLSVGFGSNTPLPIQIIYGILIGCLSFCYLGYAKFILPVAFVFVVYAWFEVCGNRGLTARQLPPPIRRRLWLWVNGIGGGYVVVALASLFLCNTLSPWKSASMREYLNREDETSEWWFVPYSGAYEKLGLRATFSSLDQPGKNDSDSLPACNVSLIVHRKDMETPLMKVTLPGLRASYRFPATNSWDYTFILDKDSLVEWLHKGAGLDTAAPKFQEEAGQIYGLIKAYELQPPQTVKELVNLAKADLRDFWFGGMQGGGFSFSGFSGINMVLLLALLVGESLISMAFTLWATRRLYRAVWVEIAAGRWTPPRMAQPFPMAIKVVSGLLALSLACAVLAGMQGERDQHYATLIAYVSLAIILIFALQRYSRQRIQQAREKGLWPQVGEVPTLEHVKGLAQAGEKILAIKLYRQIHRVSLPEAKAAVEKLAG